MRITYLICGLLYASFAWPRPDWPTVLTDGLVATEVCHSSIEHPVVSERLTEPSRDLLPLDDFQRAAIKALRGDYGELTDWQRDGYTWGLAQGVLANRLAKVTAYGYKWESTAMAGGVWTASGAYVNLRGVAANPELPFGTLIWTEQGLRYVTDRGGWVKVGRAFVHGRWKQVTSSRETANLDYYTWGPVETIRETPWCIVKPHAQTDRGTWHRTVKDERP